MADRQSDPGRAVRPIDEAAVAAALRRMARATEPPWLHGEVARRMGERLALIRLKPQVLVDWCAHTGRGAAVLAAAYPRARRLIVEPVAALRERSRLDARRPWWAAWRGAVQSVEVLDGEAPPGIAQLVWSNMALHAAIDPPAVLTAWQHMLAADGFVMFSCFGPDTVRELRALYRQRGWGRCGADFVDMHDIGDMLVRAGFADPVMDQELLTLNWPTPEAALAELRTLGGNAAPDRAPGLRTPRWRQQLDDDLRSLADDGGRLSLTFEVVFGHAFKAVPRQPGPAETTVSLDEMRALARSPRSAAGG